MRSYLTLAALVASSMLFTGCKSVDLQPKAAVEEKPVAQDPRTVGEVRPTEVDPLNDKNSPLAKRSVYFDYDSYTVKDEFKPTVSAHGQYLANNKNRKIVIQGNTDERGGREYNLALGQKRAEAVRQALSLLGVPETQMEAVSFGEEKPRATGSDEAAWGENRRADIVYQ